MSERGQLRKYREKRDFTKSSEPEGSARSDRAEGRCFVVQRHEASTLHFDFRLQVGDVLASWAVPKGPSMDPGEKRLATRTEDHPLEYADFEGRIAEGEYGAGTVIVWDIGTYRNLTERNGELVPAEQAVEGGHIKFWLDGQKLTGGFALTRTRFRGREDQWLLVKVKDGEADRRRTPAKTQPESVLTGRTNEDL
jgi:DNA ligase D-like protein (predicted 3'-phosphoesterase)